MAAQREWFEKDYYKVLGVVSTATDKEITRAYRKLAKQYHPDANPGSEDRFKEISAAYDVLGDADKRKEYDDIRKHGRYPEASARHARRRDLRVEDMGNLGDLFGGLFATGDGRRPPRAVPTRRRHGSRTAPVVLRCRARVTTSVNVPEDARCSNCRGTGAAPGTATHTCPRSGDRESQRRPGLFSSARSVPTVSGGHPVRQAVPGLARARGPNARCAR